MPKQIGFTRWYDRSPQVSQAVRTLEKSHSDFQKAIAEVINELSDLRSLTHQNEGGLKKIGSQKILGLMKSKAKRRWYDENPQMHKAINTMYVMSEEEREEIALKVLVSLGGLNSYKNRCTESETPPSYREMLAIVKSVFQKDTLALKGMTRVRDANEAEATQHEVNLAPPGTNGSHKAMVESDDGFKITANRIPNNTLI